MITGEFTVHECASTLKTFLSDLPEPLLTDAYYKAHCQVANMNDVEFVSKKIQCLNKRKTSCEKYSSRNRHSLCHMQQRIEESYCICQTLERRSQNYYRYIQILSFFSECIDQNFTFLILAEMNKCKRVPISNDGQEFLLIFGNGSVKCCCGYGCGKVFSSRGNAMRHVKKEHQNVQGSPQEEEDEQ